MSTTLTENLKTSIIYYYKTSKTKRASKKELLDFANAIRKAGGGNSLDALLPGEPSQMKECVIARNLNFKCEVNGDEHGWYIRIRTGSDIITRLVDELRLQRKSKTMAYLPANIGCYARDFDLAGNFIQRCLVNGEGNIWWNRESYNRARAMWDHMSDERKEEVPDIFKTKNGNLKEWRRLGVVRHHKMSFSVK